MKTLGKVIQEDKHWQGPVRSDPGKRLNNEKENQSCVISQVTHNGFTSHVNRSLSQPRDKYTVKKITRQLGK